MGRRKEELCYCRKSSASSAQAVAVQEQHSALCKASRSTENVLEGYNVREVDNLPSRG